MKCLASLRPGFAEWKLILIANGEKLSEEVVELASSLTPHLKLIESNEKLAPGRARNLGLQEVEGEWIFFIDDDAYVPETYWGRIQSYLSDPDIEVLGGPDSPAQGMKPLAQALAITLASPLCTGATFARHQGLGKTLIRADEEKLTSCNLWIRRSILGEIRFPEHYRRTEENFFLQALTQKGAQMFYHPKLVVAHHRRNKLTELWRPSFQAGFYRSCLMREKMAAGSEAFWLPSIFVLLHLLLFIDQGSFWYLARIYSGVIVAVSLGLSTRASKPWLFPIVAFLHYSIVFLYGVGFLIQRMGKKAL